MNRKWLLGAAVLLGSVAVTAGCNGGGGGVGGGGSGGGAGGGDGGGGQSAECDHEVLPPAPVKASWSKAISDLAAGVAAMPDGGFATASPDSGDGWGCRIVRFDASGTEIWAKVLSAKQIACDAVAGDAAGNVYVAGNFIGQIDGTSVSSSFDDADVVNEENGGMGSDNDNVGDLFVVKLDGAGAVQFLRNFGSAGADMRARIAVAPDGKSVLTGRFRGGVSFGLVKQGTAGDVHVAGLGPDGAVLWTSVIAAEQSGLSPAGEAVAIAASGEAYVAATIQGLTLARIDGGVTTWRRDYDGAFADFKPLTAYLPFTNAYLAIGTDQNLVIAGQMGEGLGSPVTVDLGTGAITGEAYLATVSPDGDTLWSLGLDADMPAMALDAAGSIHLVGRSGGSLVVGLPPAAVAAGPGEMFTAKLGQDGALLSSVVAIASEPAALPLGLAATSAGADVIVGYQSGLCGVSFGQEVLPPSEGFLVSVSP